MKIWNLAPVLRLLIPFTGGIVLQLFYPFSFEILITCLLVSLSITCITFFLKSTLLQWKYRWITGASITMLFFSIGCIRSYTEKETNQPSHFQYHKGTFFLASVDEPLVEKNNSYKTVAKILAVKQNNVWKNTTGKLLIYFSKQAFDTTLFYGDCFVFASPPQAIPPPQNPEEFNYKRFLSFHNVYQQVYLAPKKWDHIHKNIGQPILSSAYHLRNHLISILHTMIPERREFAVASALVIGYEDALDAELINAYASSGALHVLSVSGMHVGAIFIVLTWLLRWMKRWKWGVILRFILLLSFLWWYALITGFSPSVLRSAAMLSIVIIGQWLKSNSGIMNTLVVSVFVLLLYNPFMITEVGFQLSYLAVFGIVYLHPKLFPQLIMPNRLLHQIWTITSVSLCAQLMTFPLGLLYFHQFPNLFVVSNLIIIPVTTAIIYGCIALMSFASVQYVGVILAKICAFAIWFVNQTVLLVDRIPYAVTNGISITVLETWLIYVMIFFGLFYLMQKRAIMLQGFLLISILLVVLQIQENLKINKQQRMVVYNINNHSAIDLVNGRENIFISDTILDQDKNALRFHIRQHWWKNGLYATVMPAMFAKAEINNASVNYFYDPPFLFFADQKWVHVDSSYANKLLRVNVPSQPLKADVLLLSENAHVTLKRLSQFISASQIIIDSSNKKWKSERWMKEADSLKLNCYSVPDKGAFIQELNQ